MRTADSCGTGLRLAMRTRLFENEINARTQQIEGLTKRLEGLKRALELFRSDQAAITESLRALAVGPLATQPAAARPAGASKVSSVPRLKPPLSPAESATAFARSSRPSPVGGEGAVGRPRAAQ